MEAATRTMEMVSLDSHGRYEKVTYLTKLGGQCTKCNPFLLQGSLWSSTQSWVPYHPLARFLYHSLVVLE
jgi:hypothetical protein